MKLDHRKMIYNTLIKPVYEYAIPIWGHKISRPLIKMHKKCIRVLNLKPKHAHVEPLLNRLKLLQLQDLYKQKSMGLIMKVHEEAVPKILTGIFEWYHEDTRTSKKYQIRVTPSRDKYQTRNTLFWLRNLWNNPDIELQYTVFGTPLEKVPETTKGMLLGKYYLYSKSASAVQNNLKLTRKDSTNNRNASKRKLRNVEKEGDKNGMNITGLIN